MAITQGMIKVQMTRETMSVFTGHPLAVLLVPFRNRESRAEGRILELACDLSSRAKMASVGSPAHSRSS